MFTLHVQYLLIPGRSDYKYSSVHNMKPAAVAFEEEPLSTFPSDGCKQRTLGR